MSAVPAEPSVGTWWAPGAEPEASPVMSTVVGRLDGVLGELDEVSLRALRDEDVARLLDELTAASDRLTRQMCRVAAEADCRRLGDATGARHTHDWWAHRSRLTRAEAARLIRLGRVLDDDAHAPTERALASGMIRAEQARVIVEAAEAIPATVRGPDGTSYAIDSAVRDAAVDHLLAAAADHDARALRVLGKRVLDVVVPELGESQEAAALAAEEARAHAGAELVMVDDGTGRCHGRFTVPSHVGAMLRRHLLALANPARHTTDELKDVTGEWKALRHRLGEALMEYVERYPADHVPQTAGVSATVVVTMTLDQLLAERGTALLDDGSGMTAGQARRLACEAGIVPAVLGSRSQPLDLGRAARLFSKAQRTALALRDGGCTAQGCTTAASGCHAHHDQPWSRRGLTDLANGRLLCPRHHRLAHDSHYAPTVHADNTLTFVRRT